MNKICKGIILIAIITSFTILMPGFIDSTNDTVKANEAGWSESGSGEDAFLILEIVPYRGLSEIGYLVGGQEPINKELFSRYNAKGELDFLGGAISNFNSHIEGPLPSSGSAESGYRPVKTIATQNGYFENVGKPNGGRYIKTTGDSYERVVNGTGSHNIRLTPGDMQDVDGPWNPTVQNNVKAYFVFGKPSGVALYNPNSGHEPRSVTANPTKTGDYDYDPGTGNFLLNKGKGAYDVIFKKGGTSAYYMTADYEIVDDNSGSYSFPVEYFAQTGGNYNKVTGTLFTYNESSGTYRWTQDNTALSKPSNYYEEGSKTWVKGQKVTLINQYMYGVELINNEYFKRMTLGIPSSQAKNYPVRVIAITPDELNLPENQHYIDEANLFYINSKLHNSAYITLYETRSFEGLSLPSGDKYNANQSTLNFDVHDLSWTSVEKIFKRAAGIGCHKAAVIMDNTFYFNSLSGILSKSVTVSYDWNSNNATMCNMAKMYIMLTQRNMVDFYNSFMNPNTSNYLITEVVNLINRTGTTGSFIRPDSTNPSPSADEAIYWNGNTFLPYGLNSNGEMVRFAQNQLVANGIYNFNLTASTDLTNNVLTTNGTDIFTKRFTQSFSVPSDSLGEVSNHHSYLDANGNVVYPTSGFSLSDIISVITNDSAGYQPIGGVSFPDGSYVEGAPSESVDPPEEPANDGTEDSNLRSYKRVLNIQPTADFADSELQIRNVLANYEVQIINMTSTQFNGSMEDINARYDMIFMGSGAKRFNLNASNATIFNRDSELLTGMIYFGIGDRITIKDGRKEHVRYRGNDITTQKRRELESFLVAGYPIVLDNGMYQLTNLQSGTVIRAFISQAKSNTINFLNYANFISSTTQTKNNFIYRLENAFKIVRPIIRLIEPTLAEGTAVNYVYANPETDLLKIQFSLLPKGSTRSPYYYDAFLYIDTNGDGIFDQVTEKVNVVSQDGSHWENLTENKTKIYTYQYDMSGLNGVYQWKVVIKRQDNNEIRGAVSGYAANTSKEDIYILQIVENSAAFSLQSRVNNSASLIWEYASEHKLKDYNIIFETLTVQQFQQLYTSAPYTTATAASTNKLSKYHLLIMDNPSTAISSMNGAVLNIKDEIDKNLGVIFTKNALSFSRQASYFNTNKSKFIDEYTYNYNNRYADEKYKGSNQLYIYNSLGLFNTLRLDATYNTTYLTKTNEGTITRYPYQINQAMAIAQNFYSEDVVIDYDLFNNKKLIGWYCLSDSKSPVIRNAGLETGGSDNDLYKGMYSSSPNDVKNNYYLFSDGSTYYSGIRLAFADQYGNDEEIKLFVNTIIAAYKTTGRAISKPPLINIINPEPVIEEGSSIQSIYIRPEHIVGEEFILTFEIKESSSNMDLQILLDDLNPAGSWNEKIYRVVAGVISDEIAINNTSKAITKGTYALKIPIIELDEEHKLTISAVNAQGSSDSIEVLLKYTQMPVVTINDPAVITSVTNKYIYVDIDYNAIDTDENYLNDSNVLRVEFEITQCSTDVFIRISDGVSLDSVYVRKIDGDGNDIGGNINLSLPTPIGRHAMYIPISMMKGFSSRDIKITAENTAGTSGEDIVTLLRRSLFQLD